MTFFKGTIMIFMEVFYFNWMKIVIPQIRSLICQLQVNKLNIDAQNTPAYQGGAGEPAAIAENWDSKTSAAVASKPAASGGGWDDSSSKDWGNDSAEEEKGMAGKTKPSPKPYFNNLSIAFCLFLPHLLSHGHIKGVLMA